MQKKRSNTSNTFSNTCCNTDVTIDEYYEIAMPSGMYLLNFIFAPQTYIS